MKFRIIVEVAHRGADGLNFTFSAGKNSVRNENNAVTHQKTQRWYDMMMTVMMNKSLLKHVEMKQ